MERLGWLSYAAKEARCQMRRNMTSIDTPPLAHKRLDGLILFHHCQRLARRRARLLPRQILLPCGPRIFYYARLVLLRRGIEPAVEPTRVLLSQEVGDVFLALAPQIAERLETEFPRAIRLLTDPVKVIPQVLAEHPVPCTPVMYQLLTTLAGTQLPTLSDWQLLWEACWQQILEQQLLALVSCLSPEHLLVAPVAHSNSPDKMALRLLQARLAHDATTRSWRIPPPQIYLYDEMLIDWLMRQLFAEPWFREFWRRTATQVRPAGSEAFSSPICLDN